MLYVIRLNQSRILLYFIFWFGLVRVLFLNGERERENGVCLVEGGECCFRLDSFRSHLLLLLCRNHIHRPSSIDGQLSWPSLHQTSSPSLLWWAQITKKNICLECCFLRKQVEVLFFFSITARTCLFISNRRKKKQKPHTVEQFHSCQKNAKLELRDSRPEPPSWTRCLNSFFQVAEKKVLSFFFFFPDCFCFLDRIETKKFQTPCKKRRWWWWGGAGGLRFPPKFPDSLKMAIRVYLPFRDFSFNKFFLAFSHELANYECTIPLSLPFYPVGGCVCIHVA